MLFKFVNHYRPNITKNQKTMKKNYYTEPLCQVIEIELESTLCESLTGDVTTSASVVPDAPKGNSLWN